MHCIHSCVIRVQVWFPQTHRPQSKSDKTVVAVAVTIRSFITATSQATTRTVLSHDALKWLELGRHTGTYRPKIGVLLMT